MSKPRLVSKLDLLIVALLNVTPSYVYAASSTIAGRQAVSKVARPPTSGAEGSPLTLTAPDSVAGARYEWDLDNNGRFERRGQSVSVRFSDNGTYRVRYRIIPPTRGDSMRAAALTPRSAIKRIAIENVPPTANVGSNYQARVGSLIQFQGSATDRSREDRQAGFTYIWNFGDGSAVRSGRNLSRPSHRYSHAGTYMLSLSVRDKDKALSAPSTTTVVVEAEGGDGETPNPPPAPITGPTAIARPTEIQDILGNPGMGWQSNDKVNPSGYDSQGLKNSEAYIKFYWSNLETSPGVYNWSTLDQRISQAAASGQSFAFRIVIVDNLVSAPAWLRDEGAQGVWFQYVGDPGNPTVWTPYYSDAKFQQRHFAFLQALGNRYNNNPTVSSVDIGTVGLWGEWHFGETSPQPPMPSSSDANLIIDKYFEYFPTKKLVAQLENQAALTHAVQRGAGFRGDCLGNVQWQNRVSPPGMYDMRIAGAQAQNSWKDAPVVFETCWTIQYWVNQGWNVRQIFDWALANHISAVNNKNTTVPSAALGEVQRLMRFMGYRFVLRQLEIPRSARAGERITVSMDWENVGVAPSYQNHRLAFLLRNSQGTEVARSTTNTQVRQWLPGPIAVDESLQLPAGLAPGTYTLAVGVVNPATGNPAVQLAIAGRDGAGWYPVVTLQVD